MIIIKNEGDLGFTDDLGKIQLELEADINTFLQNEHSDDLADESDDILTFVELKEELSEIKELLKSRFEFFIVVEKGAPLTD